MSAPRTGSAAHSRRIAKGRSPDTALAEADELLNSERLQRILNLDSGGLPVVSMYLALDPGPGDLHAAAKTKADSLLHEVRALEEDQELDHERRMSLRGDIEAIEELVERSARTPGALAIISCSGADALELVRLPRAVRDRIMVDETPWVRPLLAVLDEHHRCFAVVVDRELAHAWELYLGKIRDYGPLARDANRTLGPRAGDESRLQHKAEELEKRHYREVAAALGVLLSGERGDVVALGGHEDELPRLVEQLPRPLRERVAGTFAIDPAATRNAGLVQEHAQAVLDRYELELQVRSVANVLAKAAAGDFAVVGLDACLWAGSVAAVQTLYVQEGTIRPGVACDRSRWFATSGERCPVCGDEMRRTPDVINELTEIVIDEGGSVRQVRAATELREHLLACSLRFELPEPG